MDTLQLESVVAAAMLIGLRVGGLMLFAPFFSSAAIPGPMKVALTVTLTFLLYSSVRPVPPDAGALAWVGIAGGEVVVGLLLGLALQFVLEAAQAAGQILGVQAGYSLVTLLDPQTQADTPVMATFSQLVALLIFLQLGVHHWLLRALASSFRYLPPGGVLASLRASTTVVQAAGGIWLTGMQIAAPVVIVTFLADIALGFLSKASPQMPILFLGLPVKTLLSLAVLAGALWLWPEIFEARLAAGIGLGERLLHLAK